MMTMRATFPAAGVAGVMWSVVLAACGPAPTPAGEAAVTLTSEAIETVPAAASARTAGATPGREASAAAPAAHASSAGELCSPPHDEPAPIDGGRPVTAAAEPDEAVRELPPPQD